MHILDVGKLEGYELTNQSVDTLLINMKKLLSDKIFSDVVFIVESKPIYAHKGITIIPYSIFALLAILAIQCEHFRAMFMNGMKESTQQQIEIKDWTFKAYLLMMEFLYTGTIQNFNATVALDLIGIYSPNLF